MVEPDTDRPGTTGIGQEGQGQPVAILAQETSSAQPAGSALESLPDPWHWVKKEQLRTEQDIADIGFRCGADLEKNRVIKEQHALVSSTDDPLVAMRAVEAVQNAQCDPEDMVDVVQGSAREVCESSGLHLDSRPDTLHL